VKLVGSRGTIAALAGELSHRLSLFTEPEAKRGQFSQAGSSIFYSGGRGGRVHGVPREKATPPLGQLLRDSYCSMTDLGFKPDMLSLERV
jgi:hypothetical protein